MSVEIVIPWAGGCPHRERALAWVRDRYADAHPSYRVTIADAPPGAWVKALAVMPAIAASTADVVVVADADVWCDRIADAVEAVTQGVMWAIPHSIVNRLAEAATAAVLAGEAWQRQPLEQDPYRGIEGGGLVVARRETLLEIPLDPRFAGWGQEDHSWGMALHALLGPCWRSSAPLVHLWHPAQPRLTRKHGSRESWELFRRYCKARHDHQVMRALTREAKDALQPAEPALRDHAPAGVH